MLFVGLLFLLGEWIYKKRDLNLKEVNQPKALMIGIAQAVALIPGVSRSGATIVSGLILGVERSFAARFSFLLGMPAILGAGILTWAAPSTNSLPLEFLPAFIGFSASFLSSLLAITFLMRFLKKHTLAVFALYRITLGILVFF